MIFRLHKRKMERYGLSTADLQGTYLSWLPPDMCREVERWGPGDHEMALAGGCDEASLMPLLDRLAQRPKRPIKRNLRAAMKKIIWSLSAKDLTGVLLNRLWTAGHVDVAPMTYYYMAMKNHALHYPGGLLEKLYEQVLIQMIWCRMWQLFPSFTYTDLIRWRPHPSYFYSVCSSLDPRYNKSRHHHPPYNTIIGESICFYCFRCGWLGI